MPLQRLASCDFLLLLLLCVISLAPKLAILAGSPSTPTSSSANLTLSALLSLKASITSDPTGFLLSWNASTHFCSCQGIVCSNSSQQVEGLLLQSKQLVGTLTPQLADLQGLSYLNVSDNSLYGPIPARRVIAVKRLNVADSHGVEARRSFVNELKTICKVRHRNLVKVTGYCVERGEVALVMEYMEKGDLDGHLYGGKGSLSWDERLNVALDVAEGLVYLHHEYVQPIIHCDLKPKSILLRTDGVAKISDFGIAKLLDLDDAADMSISKFRGTFGYAAPEYVMGARISTKVDVYSYGVLLLELVSRRRPTNTKLQEEGMSLHTWARTLHESGRTIEVVDKTLLAEGEPDNDNIVQEAKKLLELGVKCSEEVVKERPSMQAAREVVASLQKERLFRQKGISPTCSYPALDDLLQAPDHPYSETIKLLLDPKIPLNNSNLHFFTNFSSIKHSLNVTP
ncbi:hypothetical protein L7F22_049825 [Adiantum nelumboides]|nr:hypothetical protein [Adiantum nelumboides]